MSIAESSDKMEANAASAYFTPWHVVSKLAKTQIIPYRKL